MRLILIFLVIANLTLVAQNTPSVALTAGSEFLNGEQENGKSLTAGQSPNTPYTSSPPSEETQLKQNTLNPVSEKTDFNPNILIFVFLLAAIAVYFITKKMKANAAFATKIKLETEEKEKLKREMWENLSKENEEQTSPGKSGVL